MTGTLLMTGAGTFEFTCGVLVETAGVLEAVAAVEVASAEQAPGVLAKSPFFICTQYIWPVT